MDDLKSNMSSMTRIEAPAAGPKSKVVGGAIPPSPLKILREDSVDGTLSPVSSKSTGTDTDTDTRKKVISIFFYTTVVSSSAVSCSCVAALPDRPSLFHRKGNINDGEDLQERSRNS